MEMYYHFINKDFVSVDTDLHRFLPEESNDKVHIYQSVKSGAKTTIFLDKVTHMSESSEDLYKRTRY